MSRSQGLLTAHASLLPSFPSPGIEELIEAPILHLMRRSAGDDSGWVREVPFGSWFRVDSESMRVGQSRLSLEHCLLCRQSPEGHTGGKHTPLSLGSPMGEQN